MSQRPGKTEPALHALLIGVDHYLPPLADHEGPRYSHLAGCVHDAERMEELLRDTLGVPPERIRKLTAPNPPAGDDTADADPSRLPTYDRMVDAFRELIDRAAPGDQIFVHYSGHGGRTPTRFPELKVGDRYDEALVPTDVARPGSQYLRDVEISHLLSEMLDKGLLVTFVLDCCHAGGAARKEHPTKVEDPVARYNLVSEWRRDRPSRVAPEEALAESWRRLNLSRATVGGQTEERRWLPPGADHVLLLACRPNEAAFEYSVVPGRHGGAFTHWILDTLEQRGTGISYRQLHERVNARVVGCLNQLQNPQLEGDADRRVFGVESLQRRHAAGVLRVDGDRLLLDVGQAHGLRRKGRFAVFPPGWENDDLPEGRVAVVEVEDVGGAQAWARILEGHHGGPEPGSVALPLHLGPLARRRKVSLPPLDGGDHRHRRIFDKVGDELRGRAGDLLERVGDGETAEYRVSVEDGRFLIRGVDGYPLPNLHPPLSAEEENAPRLVDRLLHLVRYRHVRELRNHDPNGVLNGELRLELGRLPRGYDPVDLPEPTEKLGADAEIRPGDWICLTIRNLAAEPLDVAVLDLQPLWGIRQIHPLRGDYQALDGGGEERIALRVSLPDPIDRGTDRLKVFATVDATRYRWLELPSLGEPDRLDRPRKARNPLEELFQLLGRGGPRLRHCEQVVRATSEWTVEEVTVRVRRP